MKTLALLLLTCLAFSLSAQPIYKVVDEEGNVTYTDQKPDDAVEVVDLPDINVVDLGEDEVPVEIESEPTEPREHMEFAITSPAADEELDSDAVTIMIDSSIDLPPTTMVVVYLNDIAQPPIQSLAARYDGIGGGEHSLRAELQTQSGRVLAKTDTVNFTVASRRVAEPEPE